MMGISVSAQLVWPGQNVPFSHVSMSVGSPLKEELLPSFALWEGYGIDHCSMQDQCDAVII